MGVGATWGLEQHGGWSNMGVRRTRRIGIARGVNWTNLWGWSNMREGDYTEAILFVSRNGATF